MTDLKIKLNEPNKTYLSCLLGFNNDVSKNNSNELVIKDFYSIGNVSDVSRYLINIDQGVMTVTPYNTKDFNKS